LFGPEALEYRLQDSEAVVAICDESTVRNLLEVRGQCPALRFLVGVGGAGDRAEVRWDEALGRHAGPFEPVDTRADEGAVLIYTSGTTGPPKGALIPHRALIGNLPGFICSQNWFGYDPVVPPFPSASRATAAPSPARGRAGEGADPLRARPGPTGLQSTQGVFWS